MAVLQQKQKTLKPTATPTKPPQLLVTSDPIALPTVPIDNPRITNSAPIMACAGRLATRGLASACCSTKQPRAAVVAAARPALSSSSARFGVGQHVALSRSCGARVVVVKASGESFVRVVWCASTACHHNCTAAKSRPPTSIKGALLSAVGRAPLLKSQRTHRQRQRRRRQKVPQPRRGARRVRAALFFAGGGAVAARARWAGGCRPCEASAGDAHAFSSNTLHALHRYWSSKSERKGANPFQVRAWRRFFVARCVARCAAGDGGSRRAPRSTSFPPLSCLSRYLCLWHAKKTKPTKNHTTHNNNNTQKKHKTQHY